MSKTLMNPFSHSERKTDQSHQENWGNVSFGGGGGQFWPFPGSSANPANTSGSTNPSASAPSAGHFGQATMNIPHSTSVTASTLQTPASLYPQPVILVSPTWHAPTQPVNTNSHLSFVNETENLHITINNRSRGSVTTHLVGKGTKFSFTAPDSQELSITVVAKDTSGIIAQVDGDPFMLHTRK